MAMSTGAFRASSSSMDMSMDAVSEQPSQQQLSVALPGRQQQQQHMSGHPPLHPSGPQGHGLQHGQVRSEAEMRRTSSVIAMMQVTVTEALGFN
jgi:hypothetical protein